MNTSSAVDSLAALAQETRLNIFRLLVQKVTIARCLSKTFAGIRPIDVPWFLLGQFLGGLAATLLFRWLV